MIACPGWSVVGKLPPASENPMPVMEPDLIVTGEVPVEVMVTGLTTDLPTGTSPNASEEVLRLNDGAEDFDAFS